jgi:ubiquitin carboxyl-terminal hydrolase 7
MPIDELLKNFMLTKLLDEVLWELASSSREEIVLGMDHVNKSRSLWGKADSIFIR